MTKTQNYTATLTVLECIDCHMDFGITPDFERARRKDHAVFVCPAGHRQLYGGPSTEEKLRADLAAAEGAVAAARSRATYERQLREAEGRRVRAYKGHLTRIKKRIVAGVCPVPGCRRSGFAQVMKHIASVHPEWHAEHVDALVTDA